MTPIARSPILWSAACLALVATALATRPLLPVDETRYLAVAWEMWTSGDLLVPRLNGEAYSHKPPLLFWLINLAWGIFGVGEWTARLVAPSFALGSLALTGVLARRLWPDLPEAARLAPVILVGAAFWGALATFTLFDMLVGFFTLAALIGLLDASRQEGWRGWLVTGVALGLGVLAKGPVIAVHVLPVAVAAPLWAAGIRSWRAWYAGLGAAVALAAAIALCWAIPAALAGGEAYRDAILWEQTAGRVADSFAHRGPWWLYLVALPAALLPWTLWPPAWRGFVRRPRILGDPGGRFCLLWLLLALAGLSIISGKQPHYLIPSLPAAALLLSAALAGGDDRETRLDRVLPAAPFAAALVCLLILATAPSGVTERLPEWIADLAPLAGLPIVLAAVAAVVTRAKHRETRVALVGGAGLLLVIAGHLTAAPYLDRAFDLRPVAERIAALQRAGHPVANLSKYHGQYHFLGRLESPLDVTWEHEVGDWAAAHPDGHVVAYHDRGIRGGPPAFVHDFRGRQVAIWDASTIVADPTLVER